METNEALFNSNMQGDFAYLGHFDNFWDLSDETTIRLGTSYLTGKRGLRYATELPFDSTINNITSIVWGLDFQLKWRPLEYGRYQSFIFEGEYVHAALDIDRKLTDPLHGYYIQGLYQFQLRWWVQARYEWFKRTKELYNFFPGPSEIAVEDHGDLSGDKLSVALAYVPTEFSAYRLQYNFLKISGINDQQIVIQVNVTIGSHPAHKY